MSVGQIIWRRGSRFNSAVHKFLDGGTSHFDIEGDCFEIVTATDGTYSITHKNEVLMSNLIVSDDPTSSFTVIGMRLYNDFYDFIVK